VSEYLFKLIDNVQEVEKESQESHTSPAKSGVSPKSGGDRLGSEASGSSAASSHRTSKGRLQNVGHGIKYVLRLIMNFDS
jgi:hypothetical protein